MSYWKILIFFAIALLPIERSHACTGIVNQAMNGDTVYARTLEFGQDLLSFDLLFVPRGIEYRAQSQEEGQQGARWTSQYAHVGFSPFGMSIVADGLNEKGLACGAFYFPGWAKYEQPSSEASHTISNLDFVSWVLGNFSTVSEVIDALKVTKVVGVMFKPWGTIPPLHYIVVDQRGNKVVIEYVKGTLNLHELPLSTITNSPSYDWHMINARNYIGLRALNHPTINIQGKEISYFGQGSGAIGLPGDFTPPSRFIRAAFLNQVVLPAKEGLAGVERAFKILNQFDIPKGAIREKGENGKDIYDETQWTSAADLTSRRYFYHTAKNRVIQFVNLKELNLNAQKIQSLSINTSEAFVDVSAKFN